MSLQPPRPKQPSRSRSRPAELERARALMAVGRHREAAGELARCLARQPDLVNGWARLGSCRLTLGDPEGALDATDHALAVDPRSGYAWLVRCAVLVRLERSAEAVQAADEAVRGAPESWRGHQMRALALEHAGDQPGALAAARHAVRLGPEQPEAHFVLGRMASRGGHAELAEESFRTVLRLDPEHSDARVNLTTVLFTRRRGWRRPLGGRPGERRGRRLGEALTGYADAMTLDPGHRAAHANLGVLLWVLAVRARWLGVLCLLIGMVGAAVAGAGTGEPPRPGELGPRLVALAVLGAVCGLWGWREVRGIPPRLRRPLLRHARRSRPVQVMAAGVLLVLLGAVCLLAVPWTNPGFLGALVAGPTLALLLAFLISRLLLSRSRRTGR
ncbi:tetratricopeptide repeat protein [Streptomyces sp. B6B3]|uniref:tetratricopeptide repeat protein n=1 Tax=Streptomyces sp. B6B3 TaxID=3153570 RepID=UPI00325E4DD1